MLNIPNYLELKKLSKKGKGIISKKNISRGIIVIKFDEGVSIRPNKTATPTAIQIDQDSFLDSHPKQIRDYLNHSCDSNTKIDFNKMACIAIKDIKKGDEITFNYFSTEYDLAIKNEDFTCFCGANNCFKQIKGFKHLNKEQRKKLKSILTPYLTKKI